MGSNVVDLAKHKEIVADEELTLEEGSKAMLDAVLAEEPETIIILALTKDGSGMLAHTPLASRLHTLGAIDTMHHWIFENGLSTSEID